MQIGCAGLKPVWVSVKGWDCKGWVQLDTAGFAAPFHPRDVLSASAAPHGHHAGQVRDTVLHLTALQHENTHRY